MALSKGNGRFELYPYPSSLVLVKQVTPENNSHCDQPPNRKALKSISDELGEVQQTILDCKKHRLDNEGFCWNGVANDSLGNKA